MEREIHVRVNILFTLIHWDEEEFIPIHLIGMLEPNSNEEGICSGGGVVRLSDSRWIQEGIHTLMAVAQGRQRPLRESICLVAKGEGTKSGKIGFTKRDFDQISK